VSVLYLGSLPKATRTASDPWSACSSTSPTASTSSVDHRLQEVTTDNDTGEVVPPRIRRIESSSAMTCQSAEQLMPRLDPARPHRLPPTGATCARVPADRPQDGERLDGQTGGREVESWNAQVRSTPTAESLLRITLPDGSTAERSRDPTRAPRVYESREAFEEAGSSERRRPGVPLGS